MIRFFQKWRANRKRVKQLKTCISKGHRLERTGEMTPATMVGGVKVATGKPEFFIYGCKCGYSEITEPQTTVFYIRDYEAGEKMKREQGVEREKK